MSDSTRWEPTVSASPVAPVDSEVTLLLFRVGGQLHAVPLDEIEAVARGTELRQVPQPPPNVVGVLDRADEPIPVIDLGTVLDLPTGPARHVVAPRPDPASATRSGARALARPPGCRGCSRPAAAAGSSSRSTPRWAS